MGVIRATDEIRGALAAGRPVVALESTIVTHGMPYPENVATARAVEADIRDAGAIPATIALLDGVARIGLDDDALERLGRGGAAKASRRDLAPILARRGAAGTTVAATMHLAARAGIAVFATGGIGGVHRGAEASWDISADLLELAKTPVCVVCAGAKSILDLAKTLEVLETHGVTVAGYGTDRFPAFYARDSGHPLSHRCDTPAEVAAIIAAQRALDVPGGLLLCNPIPPAMALDAAEIEQAIAAAVSDATAAGIGGQEVTPYLLRQVVERTGGRSLVANIGLIRHNARLAAAIATALATPRPDHR